MSVYGGSLDGCVDTIAIPTPGENPIKIIRSNKGPACVILPENSFKPCIAGKEAQDSRFCRGYNWPPEARFDIEKGIRRLPISLAWRLLVIASDQSIKWRCNESSSVRLEYAIADHVASFLPEGINEIVLAIPNDLHEYGQQALISALKSRGCKATLLWRPVAAAISWCNRLPPVEVNEELENDDNLVFIHIGADSFEFVTLRLREKEHNGIKYVVPLRTQPKSKHNFSGIHILASAAELLIEKIYKKKDQEAIWQAFAVFSDLWKEAKEEKQDYNYEENKNFIQVNNKWDVWKPHKYLKEVLQFANVRPEWLEAIVHKCSDVDFSEMTFQNGGLVNYVRQGVRKALDLCQDDDEKVVGAIITGNLEHLPCGQDITLKDIIFEELNSKGLIYEELSAPVGKYIFYPENQELDLIAEGCLIYHQRMKQGLPTYYDTLPKLDIRAQVQGKPKWCSLIGDDVIEGGDTYSYEMVEKFAVRPGQREIDFYLRREGADSFRKLPFNLPDPAQTQIGLDLKVKMQPAQGFASVEVLPSKVKVFGVEHLYLDWSQMSPSPLPAETGLGYPDIFSIETHPRVYEIIEPFLQKYLETNPSMPNYFGALKVLRDQIKQTKPIPTEEGYKPYRLVNENGNLPVGIDDSLLRAVITKIGIEIPGFTCLKKKKELKYLRQTATWLYTAAPGTCYAHILQIIHETYVLKIPPDIIHAAGRSFYDKEDIEEFFNLAIDRIKLKPKGTNNWISAISRILQHRENAPKSLKLKQALFLAEFACRIMQSELLANNIQQKFKNAAHLFLYLLRWRTVGDFLQNEEEYELGQRAKKILEKAAALSEKEVIRTILEEIARYIDYQGTKIIIGFPED